MRGRSFTAAAVAALMVSCGPRAAPPAIDPAMADCVPADAAALAGLNLDALRGSPLYSRIPLLGGFGDAHYVLAASRGGEILTVQRSKEVTLNGSPDMVRAARARHARPALVATGESLAARSPIWAVVRGGTVLPVTGNLANLNRLLRGIDYLTLEVRLRDRVAVEATAWCPSPEAARRFEGDVRALASLAEAAGARQPVEVRREERSVRVSLSAATEDVTRLLH